MKKVLFLTSLTISITSCDYNKGVPVIVNKQQSFIPGKCLYTYEGFGREETFDDDCNKYQVGDTLRGQ
jgi:hypothetical protein